MRISFSKQHDIQEAIVKDLYDPPIKKIDKQKGALVLRNHTEWVGKYMPIIKQLPLEMIHTSDRIKVTIPALEPEFDQSNPSNIEAHEKCHETTWSQYVDSGLPTMMKGSGWNAEDVPIPIQEGMEEEILALRAEEWSLKEEKQKMERYLSKTMELNNTTTKLRKAFPSTLQKYIPPEPPRAARQPKLPLEQPDQPDIPTNLKQRMTENLLDN